MKATDLINDMQRNLDEIVINHPYYSFIIICSCIEFLGQCLNDNIEFNPKSGSSENFRLALEIFPDKRYSTSKLYDKLRCGMVHTVLPKPGVWLAQEKDFSGRHLEKTKDGTIILVLEELYRDLKITCNKVINMIGVSLNHEKLKREILHI